MDRIRVNSVFVAVFDKKSLEKLVPVLVEYKIKAVGTAGTVAYLQSRGVRAQSVIEGYEYGGRIKTLGRKNFVAILADRNRPGHVSHLKDEGIEPIDAVIVDLYKPDKKNFPETMDIGGQALIRAAVKNYENVAVAYDASSINRLADELAKHDCETTLSFRTSAAKAAAGFIARRAKLESDYWEKPQ